MAIPSATMAPSAAPEAMNSGRRGRTPLGRRNGCSTYLHESTEIPAVTAMRPTDSGTVTGLASACRASTQIGQCQRYSEYEIFPTHVSGVQPSARCTTVGVETPLAGPSGVPAHGSNAAAPGNGVVAA